MCRTTFEEVYCSPVDASLPFDLDDDPADWRELTPGAVGGEDAEAGDWEEEDEEDEDEEGFVVVRSRLAPSGYEAAAFAALDGARIDSLADFLPDGHRHVAIGTYVISMDDEPGHTRDDESVRAFVEARGPATSAVAPAVESVDLATTAVSRPSSPAVPASATAIAGSVPPDDAAGQLAAAGEREHRTGPGAVARRTASAHDQCASSAPYWAWPWEGVPEMEAHAGVRVVRATCRPTSLGNSGYVVEVIAELACTPLEADGSARLRLTAVGEHASGAFLGWGTADLPARGAFPPLCVIGMRINMVTIPHRLRLYPERC